jgi:hypothetical protein
MSIRFPIPTAVYKELHSSQSQATVTFDQIWEDFIVSCTSCKEMKKYIVDKYMQLETDFFFQSQYQLNFLVIFYCLKDIAEFHPQLTSQQIKSQVNLYFKSKGAFLNICP